MWFGRVDAWAGTVCGWRGLDWERGLFGARGGALPLECWVVVWSGRCVGLVHAQLSLGLDEVATRRSEVVITRFGGWESEVGTLTCALID